MKNSAAEMLDACGFKDVDLMIIFIVWEMESMKWEQRDGKDPKTSVLNKWNQVHAAKNVL
ncbi:MAG: hypothetical protein Ct9H90mP3_6250 [Flammeovirgaceae bacterium]|nr:MAG: hypothetical protein Ct9H90mP3_6250 [Flammeovirgaceae bacterium]